MRARKGKALQIRPIRGPEPDIHWDRAANAGSCTVRDCRSALGPGSSDAVLVVWLGFVEVRLCIAHATQLAQGLIRMTEEGEPKP